MGEYSYKFKEYEDVLKKIEEAAIPVTKLRKNNPKFGAQELKDKLGDKLSMASRIISLTNACIEAKELLKKLQGHNFDLRGKVADLSTSAVKKLTDSMHDNQSLIMEKIDEVKQSAVVQDENFNNRTFADIVGENKKAFVLPMKQVMKEIEEEDDRKKNIVIHGLDLDPAIPDQDEQEKKLKKTADECILEALRHEASVEHLTIMGKVGKSGRAPPVLVKMKFSEDARLVLKNASRLSKVKELRRVYITPDLTRVEREEQKKLRDVLKAKIMEFPDQHWVIRQGSVYFKGNHTRRLRLDSKDDGKELDRSFNY